MLSQGALSLAAPGNEHVCAPTLRPAAAVRALRRAAIHDAAAAAAFEWELLQQEPAGGAWQWLARAAAQLARATTKVSATMEDVPSAALERLSALQLAMMLLLPSDHSTTS